MTSYKWDNNSPVTELEITLPKKGAASAVIHFSDVTGEGKRAQLASLPQSLRTQGFAVIADTLDNKPVLRVTNIKSPDALLDTLDRHDYLQGKKHKISSENKKGGILGWWKRNTGKAAGGLYMGGDISMAAGGLHRAMAGGKKPEWKDLKQFMVGLSWGIAGLGLNLYGSEPGARKQERLLQETSKFFWQEAIDVPETNVLHGKKVRAPRNVLKKFEDMMYKYPTQFLNTIYAAGALLLINYGLSKDKHLQKRNWGKAFAGIFVFLGTMVGLLMPEKKRDPTKETGLLSKTLGAIRERPLLLSSALFYANNASMGVGAYNERKHVRLKIAELDKIIAKGEGNNRVAGFSKKDDMTYNKQRDELGRSLLFPIYDYVTAGTYFFGNASLAKTSKTGGHGGGAGGGIDVANTVYAAAAEVLLGLPQDRREEIIPRLAEYLRKSRGLSTFAEDIEAALRQKVETLASHPLLASNAQSSMPPAPLTEEKSPVATTTPEQKKREEQKEQQKTVSSTSYRDRVTTLPDAAIAGLAPAM